MDWNKFAVALFDLDGVLTPTTDLHMQAWATMFNRYLGDLADQVPYTQADYFAYVDGKPRYEGVRTMLASRGIPVEEDEIIKLGDQKNMDFNQLLATQGIAPYPGTMKLLNKLRAASMRMCVVSSSRNAMQVLAAAELTDYFAHIVDGNLAREQHLQGKPAADTYAYAANLCGVTNAQAVVVEDAISGVQAGRAGQFGFVLGVNRGVGAEALYQAGADLVVDDLEEVAK